MQSPLPDPDPDPEPRERLSDRQKEVIVCAAIGLTNLQIAERLFISPRSVDRALKTACDAFDAPNRVVLVAQAYRAGIVTDDHLADGC
jgi:DNA-binding CsgD family transcriptional regulator